MKKYHIIICFLLLTFASCVLDPCMDKESFLKSYDKFIEKVESFEENSVSDWSTHDAKFEKFITECYERHENTLTLKEKKDFWIKSMKYYHEKYGDDFYDKLDEEGDVLAEKISEEIEKVFETSGQDALDYIREVYGEDIEKTIDDVMKEIEKLSQELKNVLSK